MPAQKRKVFKKIAIVVSDFNQTITHRLLEGARKQLLKKGMREKNITVLQVPGAIEIPLAAQWLAQTKQYQAIICLGAVVRGETGHYDYVCQQVSDGCQTVMLKYNVPIIFGILTTDTIKQALSRAGGRMGHKGIESADAALAMIALRDLMYQ